MWKIWQVLILITCFAMWIGWTIYVHRLEKAGVKDDSCENDMICMINAANFILVLLIFS